MDETKWSFEASGMYRSYLSIAEKRTSFRRQLNVKSYEDYLPPPPLPPEENPPPPPKDIPPPPPPLDDDDEDA